ncbi:hypothetical protein LguiA_019388 [Lonicera macranthoides]
MWKENPLLTEDPHEKTAAHFWAEFNDDRLLPSMVVVFSKQGEKQEYHRRGADLKLNNEEKFPLLSAWTEAFPHAPVIKECWPDQEKLLIKYQLQHVP